MKLLLIFALCGVTCCLAGPTCSKDELNKCFQGPPLPEGSSPEEELERFCRETTCFVEIYERCGTSVFAVGPFPVKGYRRVINAFCHRSSPLREKYFETAKCVIGIGKGDGLRKMLDECDIKDRPKEEFCRKIPSEYECAVNYVAKRCGKDAGEVAQAAFYPYLDPYDCLSS